MGNTSTSGAGSTASQRSRASAAYKETTAKRGPSELEKILLKYALSRPPATARAESPFTGPRSTGAARTESTSTPPRLTGASRADSAPQ